jgi:hypothetical protein
MNERVVFNCCICLVNKLILVTESPVEIDVDAGMIGSSSGLLAVSL